MARQTAAQVATDRAAALFAAEGPTSAPDIADGLGGRVTGMNLSSVYRNLGQLEQLGVVRRVHAGAGPVLYVLQDGSRWGCATTRTPTRTCQSVVSAAGEIERFKADL